MWPCSLEEDGLYDYILYNDNVEVALEQLTHVAERALAGQVNLLFLAE